MADGTEIICRAGHQITRVVLTEEALIELHIAGEEGATEIILDSVGCPNDQHTLDELEDPIG